MSDPEIKPTEEQEACIQAASSGQSLMISAYAGCAKSSTLELMAPRVKEPTLALAFNKKIAQELERRLPGNFTAKTLNGLGHGAWLRANPSVTSWKLDDKKLGKLVSEVCSDRADKFLWEPVLTAAKSAMVQGIVPRGTGPAGLIEDELSSWDQFTDCDEEDLEHVIELAREALRRDIALAKQGTISFDDQIYCPTLLGGRWPKYPRVFGDEVQDWSPLNLAQIGHCVRPGGLFAVVGDQLQSIYAFRGADSEAMIKVRGLASQWLDLPLTMTFRCPQLVVKRQQAHAPGYRAFEGNPQGEIWEWKSWGPADLAGGMTVLCRNMAPLMKLAFRLLRAGVGCQVAGRDIGRSLLALSRKISEDDSLSASQFIQKIQVWRARQAEIAIARDQMEKLESIEDRAEALLAVLESSGASSAGDLRSMLEQLFSRESGLVLLSTIHRAKGLEWPRVMHLDGWRIPSKFAKKMPEGPARVRALQQEANLRYVAETRTRQLLVLADLDGWEGRRSQ